MKKWGIVLICAAIGVLVGTAFESFSQTRGMGIAAGVASSLTLMFLDKD